MSFQHSENLRCHMGTLYGMATLHRFLQHLTVSIHYVCSHDFVLFIFLSKLLLHIHCNVLSVNL